MTVQRESSIDCNSYGRYCSRLMDSCAWSTKPGYLGTGQKGQMSKSLATLGSEIDVPYGCFLLYGIFEATFKLGNISCAINELKLLINAIRGRRN